MGSTGGDRPTKKMKLERATSPTTSNSSEQIYNEFAKLYETHNEVEGSHMTRPNLHAANPKALGQQAQDNRSSMHNESISNQNIQSALATHTSPQHETQSTQETGAKRIMAAGHNFGKSEQIQSSSEKAWPRQITPQSPLTFIPGLSLLGTPEPSITASTIPVVQVQSSIPNDWPIQAALMNPAQTNLGIPQTQSEHEQSSTDVVNETILKEETADEVDVTDSANSSDTSDMSSMASDMGDSGSEDDSEDEDEDYELMDPIQQAKILMAEATPTDRYRSSSKKALTNERDAEEEVHVVDLEMTDDKTIVYLGVVESVIANQVVVKDTISEDGKVLDTGSVLCLENRTIIGAVASPFGRVDDPRYTVAFKDEKDITQLQLSVGVKIFYVEGHIKIVFGQKLKNERITDADPVKSEGHEHEELFFSDDEKEKEYKEKMSLAKRIKKENKYASEHSRYANSNSTAPVVVKSEYPTAPMKYEDDDSDVEDLYTPLRRPSLGGPPIPNARPPFQQFGRGRGNQSRGNRGGRDRGRGMQRGGRGGHGGHGGRPQSRGGHYQDNRVQYSEGPSQDYRPHSQGSQSQNYRPRSQGSQSQDYRPRSQGSQSQGYPTQFQGIYDSRRNENHNHPNPQTASQNNFSVSPQSMSASNMGQPQSGFNMSRSLSGSSMAQTLPGSNMAQTLPGSNMAQTLPGSNMGQFMSGYNMGYSPQWPSMVPMGLQMPFFGQSSFPSWPMNQQQQLAWTSRVLQNMQSASPGSMGTAPPGAFVNPNFYSGSAQPQQSLQQYPAQQSAQQSLGQSHTQNEAATDDAPTTDVN